MEKLIQFNADYLGPEVLKPKSKAMDNLPRISSSTEQLFSLCGIESRQNLISSPKSSSTLGSRPVAMCIYPAISAR